MNTFPCIILTKEMIDEAMQLVPKTKVNRTIASSIDTLTGILGEFVFAQWFYGNWRHNFVGANKGKTDLSEIEIKTSAFPMNRNLHLRSIVFRYNYFSVFLHCNAMTRTGLIPCTSR